MLKKSDVFIEDRRINIKVSLEAEAAIVVRKGDSSSRQFKKMEKSLETLTQRVNDLANQSKPLKKRKRPSGAQRQKKKRSRNCDAKENSDALIAANDDAVADDDAVAEMISEFADSTSVLSPII